MSSKLFNHAASILEATATEDGIATARRLRDAAEQVNKKSKAAKDDILESMNIASQAAKGLKADMKILADVYERNTQATADLREELAQIDIMEKELAKNGEHLSAQKREERDLIISRIELNRVELEQAAKKMVQLKSNQRVLQSTNRVLENQLGLGKGMEDSFLGAMFAGDKAFSTIGESVREALKPQKLMGSALAQVQKATIQYNKDLDKNVANLNKSTSSTGEMRAEMETLAMSNRRFNVDQKKAMDSIIALNESMSMFNQMSEEQRKALSETTAKLTALGVSGTTAGQSFDVLVNGLEMSHGAAQEATMEMVGLASAVGLSSETIIKDFGAASSELAKYGKDMVREFKALQGAAEATGISVSNLMSITKQFDTFEGAATSAGKLNAILGGGVINSMDLLNATEEERIRLLMQSIAASGKSYENMNRFERQAVASAAGISDMSEANKIFSQSLSAYDEQVSKTKAAKASQEDFNNMASAAISLGDKITQIGKAFAVSFGFLITPLTIVADLILMVTDFFAKWLGGIPNIIIGVMLLRGAFNKIKNTIKAFAKVIGEGLGEGLRETIEGTSEGVSTAITGVSRSVAAAAPAIATSITTIGASMGTAAVPVGAFGVALSSVVYPIAATVAAVALLVASVALLVYAMVSLVKEVGVGKLYEVASGFYLFALSISQGLSAIILSVSAFVIALTLASAVSLAILPVMTLAFKGIAAMIALMSLALYMLPDKKLISLSMATEGIASVMEAAVKLTPEAVKHTKQIVDSAADYVSVQAQMLSPDADAFVQAIKGAFGGGKDKKGGQDIVLVMNDREFARAVGASINGMHNLNID